MSDPRDYDRMNMEMDARAPAPTPWGWIAGAVFIALFLALVFTSDGTNRTASNEPNPPATTGMAPRAPLATIPPATTAPPVQAPSTSGQAR